MAETSIHRRPGRVVAGLTCSGLAVAALLGPNASARADRETPPTAVVTGAGTVAAASAPSEKQLRAADKKAVVKVKNLAAKKKYTKARTRASAQVVKVLKSSPSTTRLKLQCISRSARQWPADALADAGVKASRGCLAWWSDPSRGMESLGFFVVKKKNGKRYVSRHVLLAG